VMILVHKTGVRENQEFLPGICENLRYTDGGNA
jgi:hypothetical protein